MTRTRKMNLQGLVYFDFGLKSLCSKFKSIHVMRTKSGRGGSEGKREVLNREEEEKERS